MAVDQSQTSTHERFPIPLFTYYYDLISIRPRNSTILVLSNYHTPRVFFYFILRKLQQANSIC